LTGTPGENPADPIAPREQRVASSGFWMYVLKYVWRYSSMAKVPEIVPITDLRQEDTPWMMSLPMQTGC
jgi:hypothetical protein